MKQHFSKLVIAACAIFATAAANDCCCNEGSLEGLYIGGNVGVLSHTAHRNDLDGFLTDNAGWSHIDTGVAGGVQLGYDWRCNNSLFGIVGDWQKTSISRTLRDEPNDTTDNNFVDIDFDWFSTIRARAGLAVCDTLVYITGGAVVGRFETSWGDNPTTAFEPFVINETRWGWTAGAGAEFALGCNWSVGGEFLWMQFANRNHRFEQTTAQAYSFGHGDSAWLGRLTVNYRFGDLFSGCCW